MRCQVVTYSGSRLHERPRRFTRDGEWLEVHQILDQGREPDSFYFLVAAWDGRRYLLRYYPQQDTWEAQLR